VSEPASEADPAVERIADQAEMLGNRLAKNVRHLAKWSRRESVTCYRVYDCDIPELPLTIDRYLTEDGEHAVAWLWESKLERSRDWVRTMCGAIARTLGITDERLHFKVRARQEGTSQYERLHASGRRLKVQEGGLTFLVNLEDYLDTGLFLDHRVLRARVRAEAAGKDVLNLFAYTGAFSVHAAAGGARSTTTVDMSQTYLDWARDNFAANGLLGDAHHFVRADILQWLEPPTDLRWDLAIVDPPTFSNSKKMRGAFDVQRDHVPLLTAVIARMRPGGVVYFSTNHRRFKLDEAALAPVARLEELSALSVPFDFRDRKIHRSWRLSVAPHPEPRRSATRGGQ